MPTKTGILVLSLFLLGVLAFSMPAVAQTQEALQFNSASSQYVTFGNSGTLGAKTFTIEVRFKRTGPGVATSTGTGGVSGIPLLAKGRAESDGSNLDCNYFLGIDGTTGRLVADFEDTTASNNNHPVSGTTVIQNDVWYHAAATFDGTNFRIYLNGNLEGSATSAAKPRYDSIQHASLASALTSSGAAAGFFTGILDEARIWNVARSQSQLQADMNLEVLSGSGLLARWGLNEGTGTTAGNSVASSVNGTLTNGPLWTTDSPLPLSTAAGLRFGGTNGYVTFGNAGALGLSTFTIETWFRRDGAGVPTSTGAITAVPLVTKGRGEADGSNVDCNYFLGIDGATGKLAADFEDFTASNNNHPLFGSTVITNGVWYHAAATFDGTTFKVYLNGNLEGSIATSAVPRYDSIQHAGLATAMTSTGAAAGFLNGALDEVRIWNVARSQSDIIASMNTAITGPTTGLVARWGLNEDALTTVASSAGTTVNGTITGSNWAWAAGSPMNAVPPPIPAEPTSLSASAISSSQIDLAWVDNANNETGYELERSTSGSGGPYALLITLPANSSSYSNTGLNASSEYCYRVRAVNGSGASNYAGPACATTLPLPPPADPSNLTLTAPTYGQVHVTWTDNAADETRYELERSTSGIAGPFTLIATLAANAVAYDDWNRDAGTEYCYRVRAVRNTDVSGYAGPACISTPPASSTALDFGSAGTTYATLGGPANLQLSSFTLELWFRRDGAGVGTSTGAGGIPDLIPLIAKGRAETEDPLKDINYIVGLRASDGVLCADFEEAAGTPNPSLNHPIAGITPIATGVWHHAAATYDGTTWNLYLDGNLEASLTVGRPVASASTVKAAIASALNSTNVAAGYFDGVMDEVRIWNVARTRDQIRSSANSPISTATPNLVGRWSLDEGSGTTLNGSAGTAINGIVVNTDYAWVVPGAPFNLAFTNTLMTTVDPQDGGQITRNPDLPSYSEGSSVLLTAVPASGYHFTNWSGDLTGTTNPQSVIMDADKNVVAHFALDLDALAFSGTNGYVNFGNPAELHLNAFTIELWARVDGPGVGTNTGTNGIPDLIPIVAKGRADMEDPLKDINYILGIQASTGVLAADFEEAAAPSPNPSLNHPILGTTPLVTGAWYHLAATYDGTTWRLYVNGALDASLVVGRATAASSDVAVALASALNSTNLAAGFFNGRVDEVRIWNAARTQAEIAATINQRLDTASPGLVARWGLDEGTGTTVHNTAGTMIDGTITGSGWSWTTGSPMNAVPPTPPAAPSGLSANPAGSTTINLSWTDNSSDETGFEIDRSTTGVNGAYTLLATVAANTTSYPDQNLSAQTEYCYRVRAINGAGGSAYDGPVCATTAAPPTAALGFSGSTYVTFGDPAALDLAQFTIECWFRRDGTGTTVSTGSGGVPDAIPLVTHGTSESDGSNVDENFFLGIRNSDGVLCADFEEGAGGASPGLNHPVTGVTPVGLGQWHHAAVTYDGTTWNLYLDGNLERTLLVGRPPRSDTIQHAALASSITSTGTAQGFLNGALDEVRIWNFPRSAGQIQANANSELAAPQTGLVARWALDEGVGTSVNSSAGTSVNGTITGSNYAWIAPAPFNLSFTPPAPPSGLVATAVSANEIDLNWTDNATNEATFEIQRSTTGVNGTYTLLATVAANVASYPDATATPETEYCYRVRAVNSFGSSAYTDAACDVTPAPGNTGLDLAGNTYVGFGNPSALSLTAFTIEMWLRRDGAGVGTNTGAGGIPDAIPLVTKGRAETETATTDINYFFGIRASDGVLCADFEEGAGGASPSLNHPVTGTTPIAIGSWHHVAATYDGVSLKIYFDGMLDGSLDPEQPLASASTVAVALGSALNSTNVASGFFDGAMDEVRIWNVARTEAELQSTANVQISVPTAGLVARWSLDEGMGTAVHGSAGTSISGTVSGTAYSWVSGAPFNLAFNHAPLPPVLVGPANNDTDVNTGTVLSVNVADPDTGTVTVSFYGRPATSSSGPDFTIIGLPDTQYYTGELNGGTNAIFQSQTNWIVANKASRNIVYVGQLGDCVEHGDNGGNDIEWQRADVSLQILENPITTGLLEGIPYGVCVGNHDQSPIGDPDGTTTFYNQYFGINRFTGRGYYGGHYGPNNDNWYDLFSAGGMDFIAVSFEYDTTPDAPVLAWANDLLTTYSNRRAILLSHFFCNTGNPATWGAQGQATYDALKGHSNLFLMLCGHVPGEGRRQDTFNGNTVHTLLSDYQSRTNGGNGWLRIMEFSPAHNVIRVKTYSPWLDQYEADADSSSQFTLPYNMSSSQPFTLLGTLQNVPSGSTASLPWPNLSTSTPYEWYVTVSDGAATVTGPIWRFTTRPTHTITASASRGGQIDPTGEVAVGPGADYTFTMTADAGYTLTKLMVDGVPTDPSSTYTFPAVSTNHRIEAVFASPTGIEDGVPTAFVFGGISPNPAHRLTRMRFGLPRSAHVSLDVYDVNGRRVAKVADRSFEPGYHELTWSGTGEMGSVPSGIYFMRFTAGEEVMTRRFVLIR